MNLRYICVSSIKTTKIYDKYVNYFLLFNEEQKFFDVCCSGISSKIHLIYFACIFHRPIFDICKFLFLFFLIQNVEYCKIYNLAFK